MDASSFEFLLLFSVGTFVMLLLAGSLVLFVLFYQKKILQEKLSRKFLEAQHQEKMLKVEMESQEIERKRLASDLHDSVGAILSAVKMGLYSLSPGDEKFDQKIDEQRNMMDSAIQTVRQISHDLLPPTLERFGLLQAIEELCQRFSKTSGVEIVYSQNEMDMALDKKKEIVVYRIVQEVLNNALKHSACNRIQVSVFQKTEEMILEIEDNGKGIDWDMLERDHQLGKGLGLYNIENRAMAIGGAIAYDRTRTSGTKVIFKLPLK